MCASFRHLKSTVVAWPLTFCFWIAQVNADDSDVGKAPATPGNGSQNLSANPEATTQDLPPAEANQKVRFLFALFGGQNKSPIASDQCVKESNLIQFADQ